MIEDHPTASELERYVIGADTPEDASKIEAHVAICATCATALAGEAALELKLQEVARTTPPTSIHGRARRVAIVGGLSVLACAAVLLLIPFATPAEQPPPDEPTPIIGVSRDPILPDPVSARTDVAGIACINPRTEAECKQTSRRRGLAVIYPTTQVPRYEYAAADQLK